MWPLGSTGLRKDASVVPSKETLIALFDASSLWGWASHCHNI